MLTLASTQEPGRGHSPRSPDFCFDVPDPRSLKGIDWRIQLCAWELSVELALSGHATRMAYRGSHAQCRQACEVKDIAAASICGTG